ncbi:MAG: DUF1036 domain-containing protein [Oceanicaulis sp.]|uniref:DUF1036 domain-containing protein n=1 Tax=Glycocaulis sp. TaxID=1969725 RepID=UPI0025C2842C|nr:DUF1036 domain-containing protein [Glycocaulis sp.]MCC5980634.1 DUF1036 domain-containing protein [Oceanicaulis sp.]MCH8520599.1 DUF1036 domain-containing protein [Glycocaulis sp.]
MKSFAALLAVLVVTTLAAPSARAGEVCNETSFYVEAAKAWTTSSGLAVRGWKRIAPGACARFTGIPGGVNQFLYARTTDAYLGGVREWLGRTPACVDTDDFQLEGVADCAAIGLETREFRQLSASERSRAVLVEPADFGTRALEAGVQRLLQSLGYDVRGIDGFAGRRSRAQISQFERDHGTSYGDSYEALIETLHATALERNTRLGLHVCNESSGPVGVAVAAQTNERWDSRGWWHIEEGGCLRVLARRLAAGDAFVFAQRVDASRPEPMRGGVEAFCVAPGRFLAEGRSGCAERGYSSVRFRPSPVPVEGRAELTLTDEDFEDPLL